MANCKFQIKQGSGRYTRRCDITANEAIVFTSQLDDGYVIQTQMPICSTHLSEKIEVLQAMQTPYYVVKLS